MLKFPISHGWQKGVPFLLFAILLLCSARLSAQGVDQPGGDDPLDKLKDDPADGDAAAQEKPSIDPEAAEALKRVAKALQEGKDGKPDYETAVTEYKNAIKLEPNLFNLYAGLGGVYFAQEDYDSAVDAFRVALRLVRGIDARKLSQEDQRKLQNQVFTMHRGIGGAYFKKEEYDNAINHLRIAASLSEKNVNLTLGMAYFEIEDFQRANDAFSEELSITPTSGEALFWRGKAQAKLGEYELAIEDLNEAINTNALSNRYYAELGNTMMLVGEYDKALKHLDRAIELDKKFKVQNAEARKKSGDPNLIPKHQEYAPAYLYRGKTYLQLNRFDKAEVDLKKAFEIDDSDKDILLNLGYTYVELANYTEAIETFTATITLESKSLEEDKRDPLPFVFRAKAFIDLAQKTDDEEERKSFLSKAIVDCDIALAMDDRIALAHVHQGVAYRLSENWEDAINSFGAAIKIDPESSEAYFRRAIVWFHLKEFVICLDDLESASDVVAGDARPWLWRGFVYTQQGKHLEAVNAYTKAIEINSKYFAAYQNRGLAYINMKEYEKAIKDFNEVIRTDLRDSVAYYRRGIAYSLSGDDKMALQSYSRAIKYDPGFAEAYYNRAVVQERLQKTDEANRDYAKARQLDASLK